MRALPAFLTMLCLSIASSAEPPAPFPADARLNNPWPADWEAAYQQRVQHVLNHWKDQKVAGGTYGENEKNYYPTALMAFLTGRRELALKALQEDDHVKEDHAWTHGVDFYWCFTLKGQMRKYFYFGEHLAPAYREKFLAGARAWVEHDPAARPHPVWAGKTSGTGWEPRAKGFSVDRRNTDNLRAMRDTSVYLMAEATGHLERQKQYKQKIRDYVDTLYHIGMSEWDSPNYHSHALSTYHNLYDFAKDEEVKLLAKAALDWLYATAAVKYVRGGFAAPNARDYGGNAPFLANVTSPAWLYFADIPQAHPAPDRDSVYHITSSYRPPAAVVELARKNFPRPVEYLATHPPYRDWSVGKPASPAYFETQYIAHTYQMGSAVSIDTGGPWNINAFKLLAANSTRGVDYFVANTQSILGQSFKRPGDQVAQFRNLLIYLRPAANSPPFYFQLPRSAKVEHDHGIWFIRLENTYLALHPIHLGDPVEVNTEDLADDKGKQQATRDYASERFLKCATAGDSYAGFALEVGEFQSQGAFEAFKQAVKSKSALDLASLAKGTVTLTASTAHSLSMTHNPSSELPTVTRDGIPHDWSLQKDRFRITAGHHLIEQKWLSGRLNIHTANHRFTGELLPDQPYRFHNARN